MRKKYLEPETESLLLSLEQGVMATSGQAENLTKNSTYANYDEDDFWD